jgi:hypothetical protein
MIVFFENYHHIDNGGITIKIIDKGSEFQKNYGKGIFLTLDAQYFGYPTFSTEIEITSLGFN